MVVSSTPFLASGNRMSKVQTLVTIQNDSHAENRDMVQKFFRKLFFGSVRNQSKDSKFISTLSLTIEKKTFLNLHHSDFHFKFNWTTSMRARNISDYTTFNFICGDDDYRISERNSLNVCVLVYVCVCTWLWVTTPVLDCKSVCELVSMRLSMCVARNGCN